MPIASALIWRLLALGFVMLLSGEVAAEPRQGSMDGQSRAGIRISVSVMPNFSVRRISGASAMATSRDGTVRDAFRIYSNTSVLRIRLVDQSRTAKADEAALFLISPD